MNAMKKTKTEKDSPNKKGDSGKSTDAATASVDLGFLEEDDDFEEFPAETYSAAPAAAHDDIEPVKIWEDDWDDDNIEDDFSKLLKAEFEKRSWKMGAKNFTGPVPKSAS